MLLVIAGTFIIMWKMMKLHNIYEVLGFKIMAKINKLILLLKMSKYFTAKPYVAACQSKGLHPKGLPSSLKKENGIDGFSDGVTNDWFWHRHLYPWDCIKTKLMKRVSLPHNLLQTKGKCLINIFIFMDKFQILWSQLIFRVS